MEVGLGLDTARCCGWSGTFPTCGEPSVLSLSVQAEWLAANKCQLPCTAANVVTTPVRGGCACMHACVWVYGWVHGVCVCVKSCQRPHRYPLMYALVIVALEVRGTEGKHLLLCVH